MTAERKEAVMATSHLDPAYVAWVRDVAQRFRASQIKAAVRVNGELLRFYWSLGRDIVENRAEAQWGEGFFVNFSRDLQRELPGVKGLSPKNLYSMKRCYLLYSKGVESFPQAVGDLNFQNFPQVVGDLIQHITNRISPYSGDSSLQSLLLQEEPFSDLY